MVFVEDDFGGRLLQETKILTSIVPELMTVCEHLRGFDAVEDNHAIVCQYGQDLRHDLFQFATMPTDKHGIRAGESGDICFEEITHMDVDTRDSEFTGILMDDRLAFRTNLEGLDMEMRKLETSFDGDAASAETDVPKGVTVGEVKGLEGEKTDGHFGNHLLSAIKKRELMVGDAPSVGMASCEDEAVGHGEILLGCLF